VHNTATGRLLQLTNANTGNTATDGFQISIDGSSNIVFNQYEAAKMSFYTSNAERITILPGGNVGIGTATPTTRLHIEGSGTYDAVLRLNNTGTTGANAFLVASNSSWTFGPNKLGIGIGGDPSSTYVKMTIQSDGNVGIGNTSPAQKLDVDGVVNAATGYRIANAAATGGNYLRGNGTNFVASGIQVSDVPILNQNTTGTAGNVTGIVAPANGGTGVNNGSNTLTIPASGTAVLGTGTAGYATYWNTSNSLGSEQYVSVARGGLGANMTAGAIGAIPYASSTSAYSTLAAAATGNALISGGTGTAPSWGKIGLTTHVSGTLAVGNGGTGATTLTGILQGNGASAVTGITGTANYLPKWSSSAPYLTATSQVYDNGTNVGIATSTPGAKLHVLGTGAGDATALTGGVLIENNNAASGEAAVNFKNVSTGSNYWISGLNQSEHYDIAYGSGFTNALTKIRIQANDGNVGIGTVTPGQKLDVSGGSIRTSSQLISTVATGTPPLAVTSSTVVSNLNADLLDGYHASSFAQAANAYIQNGNSFGALATLGTNDAYDLAFETSGSEKMRILSGGNVGIGTSSPLSSLTVQKTVAGGRGGEISIVNYAATATGNSAALNFGLENSTYGANDGNAQIQAILNGVSGASTDMTFSLWSGSAFNEYVRINSSGNVGIGTTSPTMKLEVVQPSGAPGAFGIKGSTGTFNPASAAVYDYTGFLIHTRVEAGFPNMTSLVATGASGANYGGLLSFWTRNYTEYPSERMRIDETGNVGIGTTSPGQKLDVSGGSIRTTNQLISTIASGTAPLAVTSTTKVTNLNVDRLDNYHAGNASGNIPVSNGTMNTNLNADLLDGYHAASFAASNHTHDASDVISGEFNRARVREMISKDTRVDNPEPQTYNPAVMADFKQNTTDGLADGGTYHGVLSFRPYGTSTDYSGGPMHQLGFTENGNLWMRTSTGSTTWGTWKQIANANSIAGTQNYVPKFITANSLGNSRIIDNGTTIKMGNIAGLGTTQAGVIIAHNADGSVQGSSDAHLAMNVHYDADATNQGVAIGFSVSTLDEAIGAKIAHIREGSYSTGSLVFYTKPSSGSNQDGTIERMRITADGNVGIGTTTPAARLNISAGDASLALFGPNTSWGGKLYVGAAPNQALAATAQVISTDGNLHLDPAPSKNMYLGYYQPRDIYINPNGGNVGIGTTAPGQKLVVNGGNEDIIASGGGLRLGANNWSDGGATYGHIITDNGSYDALMIVGNNVAGDGHRNVRIWDHLNVESLLTRGGNTVWDAGNDGSGSGSDADMLDGYHYNNLPYMTTANISGTTNYVAKFTGANSVGNSTIYDNGTNVGIGTTYPSYNFHVTGSTTNHLIYGYNSYNSGSTGEQSSIYGYLSSGQEGSGYGTYNVRTSVKGYSFYGYGYTFGVAGYRYNDSYNRGGGVLGGSSSGNPPTAWGSLGYRNSGATHYGAYWTSSGSGSGFMDNAGIMTGIGSGGYGGVMAGWSRGEVLGFTTSGELYASYDLGNSYTSGVSADIVTVNNDRVAAYSATSPDLIVYKTGKGKLINGKATVFFDETYTKLLASDDAPNVTITPIGDCKGIHIEALKSDSFSVAENLGGTSDVEFTWIAVGKRADAANASLPQDLKDKDFDRNLKCVMFNENDLDHSATPIWWDGSKIRFDKAPEQKIEKKPEELPSAK